MLWRNNSWRRTQLVGRLPLLILFMLAVMACQPVQPVVETPTPEARPGAGKPVQQAAPRGEPAQNPAPVEEGIDAARDPQPEAEALAAPVQPADPGLAQVETNVFLQLFPELRHNQPPDWLQEGLRSTYYVQNAVFAGAGDDPKPSGSGFMQYDLVALDHDAAISSLKYHMAGEGGLSPSAVTPSYGLPGVGDYWVAPEALTRAEEVANPDLAVVRMPTTAADQTYNAVRFQSSQRGGEYVWMFDEESGLLLFFRYSLFDAFGETTQAGQLLFAGLRYLDLPWIDAQAPEWVQPEQALHYEGAYSVQVPGGGPTVMPYAVDVTIQRVYPRWADCQMTTYLYGRTDTSGPRINGVAQIQDALWLPPAGTASLAPGLVLDSDPFTQVVLRVADAGSSSITLEEVGSLHTSHLVYDRAGGWLTNLSSQQQSGVGLIQVDLELLNSTWP